MKLNDFIGEIKVDPETYEVTVNGEVITSDLGLELKDTTIAQLGKAKQVKVQKENTIIVDGAGDKQKIADRVGQIKAQINETQSDYDKEQLDFSTQSTLKLKSILQYSGINKAMAFKKWLIQQWEILGGENVE